MASTSSKTSNVVPTSEISMSSDTSGEKPYELSDLYFKDGHMKIDFVLVYEEPVVQSSRRKRESPKHREKRLAEERTATIATNKHVAWRNKFEDELYSTGLNLEEVTIESKESITHCIRLNASWEVLVRYAEELNLRSRLRDHPPRELKFDKIFPHHLRIGNLFEQTIPWEPVHYLTYPFKASKLDKFVGNDQGVETYFTNTQRSRIVYEILQTSAYGMRDNAEIGIERLIQEGTYTAAYPLHEGPFAVGRGTKAGNADDWNRREILFNFWARWARFFKYQPLDHVREYFGEKVAFYFAWLGFYNGWLLPATLFGLAVYCYGLINMHTHPIPKEICESGTKYKMCPKCEELRGCVYYNLSDVCSDSKEAFLYDNAGTVVFAVFLSAWAVLFLEFWKRRSIKLAYYWDCLGVHDEEPRPRPQFAARAKEIGMNPVTREDEPVFPNSTRVRRMVAGAGIIVVMLCVVVIFIIALIVYRSMIIIPLFQNPRTRPHATHVANWSGAIMQLFVIMFLAKIYAYVARRITDWEMHRTEKIYEYHLALKVFIFQFVNFYSGVFYTAFIKGRFSGYPGKYNEVFGLRPDECKAGGCLAELADQLFVIMVGKQIINNTLEIVIPKITSFFRRRRLRRSKMSERWAEDYKLLPYGGLFSEYMEMVIQFGFITIFGAAFSLAPAFALLNNWVEIRLDAQKLICETRRIVAFRAQDIGTWFTFLKTLSYLAVIGNAFLIAFTTDFIPRTLYRLWYDWDYVGYLDLSLATSPKGTMSENCRYFDYRDEGGAYTSFYWMVLSFRLAFVVVFMFVVFLMGRLIEFAVLDIPHNLDIQIRREAYVAKQALSEGDDIFEVKGKF